MPLADTSIISPSAVSSRAPLKKSTVAIAAGLLLILALIGAIVPKAMRTGTKVEVAQKDEKAIGVGRTSAIDAEEADAIRKGLMAAKAEQAAHDAARAKGGPLPPASSPVPASAKRGDDSAALYAKQVEQQEAQAIAAEAAGRLSTSVRFDVAGQPGKDDARGEDGATERRNQNQGQRVSGQLDEAAVGRMIDHKARELLGKFGAGQPASVKSSADMDSAWRDGQASIQPRSPSLRTMTVGSRYVLLQGKIIPAVLTRDINSDLPGEVTACSTIDVYDSIVSQYLLVPRGSCFVGRYQNAVRAGQERLMFAFTRLMLPDGQSMDLPGMSGADLAGSAGVEGDVNNHFFKTFSASFLVAILAERAERGKTAPQGTTSPGAVSAAGQVLVDVGSTILQRNRSIPPTITVDKGTRINIDVTRDMEFPGPYSRGSK